MHSQQESVLNGNDPVVSQHSTLNITGRANAMAAGFQQFKVTGGIALKKFQGIPAGDRQETKVGELDDIIHGIYSTSRSSGSGIIFQLSF